MEDAKKVIVALQNLAAMNTATLESEPKVPKWKEHAQKKGPKMVKPDAFSGKMDVGRHCLIGQCLWLFVVRVPIIGLVD